MGKRTEQHDESGEPRTFDDAVADADAEQTVSDDDTVEGDAEVETTNVVAGDVNVEVTGQDNDDDARDPRRDESDYGDNAEAPDVGELDDTGDAESGSNDATDG